jgi:RNA polymerase sigma factor (TIGR02999 family)
MAMSDVTLILSQIEQGDAQAAEKLLPLFYEELRKLAAAKLAQEKPGQTLQATALVHDAYVRLVDVEKPRCWQSRGHFFAPAAEAMRRILVDNSRRKLAAKRGGGLEYGTSRRLLRETALPILAFVALAFSRQAGRPSQVAGQIASKGTSALHSATS